MCESYDVWSESEVLRQQMGRKGRRYVQENYDWKIIIGTNEKCDSSARRWNIILEKLCRKKRLLFVVVRYGKKYKWWRRISLSDVG